MDPVTIITTIAGVLKTVVDLGPTVITAVEDATPFAQSIYNLFQGQNVTQAQLDALMAEVQALSDQLQQPLPPDDGSTTT